MPNWTNNKMIITGKKEDLDRLFDEAVKKNVNGKEAYDFTSWFPVPSTFSDYDTTNHPYGKGLEIGKRLRTGFDFGDENAPIITQEIINAYKKASEEQKADYGVVGWYDYNIKFFGCKWVCDFELTRIDEETAETNVFDTPWTAPSAFCERLAQRYHVDIRLYAHYEDDANDMFDWSFDEESGLYFEVEHPTEIGEKIRDILKAKVANEADAKWIDKYVDGDSWNVAWSYDTANCCDEIVTDYYCFLQYLDEDAEEEE